MIGAECSKSHPSYGDGSLNDNGASYNKCVDDAKSRLEEEELLFNNETTKQDYRHLRLKVLPELISFLYSNQELFLDIGIAEQAIEEALIDAEIDTKIIPELTSLILDLAPYVGDIKAGIQVTYGKDVITGEKINRFYEGLGFIASVLADVPTDGMGGVAIRGIKDYSKVKKNLKNLKKVRFFMGIMIKSRNFENKIYALSTKIFHQVRVCYTKECDGKYKILDGYVRNKAIFSMKNSQLSKIQFNTAKKYIDEAVSKYSPGTPIWQTKTGNNTSLGGDVLRGKLYLVVHAQIKKIPQSILDYASKKDVLIITEKQVLTLIK